MGLFGNLFGGGGMSAQEAKAEMDSGNAYVLLDVREPGEFNSGHIPGAKLMPLSTVASAAPKEIKDQGMRILVYCKAGGRAGQAVDILKQLGYTNAVNIGGIDSWPYEIV